MKSWAFLAIFLTLVAFPLLSATTKTSKKQLDNGQTVWTGLGANVPEDGIYPTVKEDSLGRPLNGGHRYDIHFEKDQLPPAKVFWSLTSDVGNSSKRYTIGNRDDLEYNVDGSLDIALQHDQPTNPEVKANWLPTPQGDFTVVMRIHWPKDVWGGAWEIPSIERIDQ